MSFYLRIFLGLMTVSFSLVIIIDFPPPREIWWRDRRLFIFLFFLQRRLAAATAKKLENIGTIVPSDRPLLIIYMYIYTH